MAVRFTGTDTDGVAADANSDLWIVREFEYVSNTADGFDFGAFDFVDLLVEGAIYSQSDAVNSNAGSSSLNVTVTEGGTIYGSSDGIELSGDKHVVTNYGSLTGAGDAGVQFVSGSLCRVANYGDIYGLRAGVLLEGDDLQVLNSGDITSETDGVSMSGDSNEVVNHGIIAGGDRGIYTVGLAGWTASVLNSGVISGATAIYSDGEALTLRNTGQIIGNVALGGGDDIVLSAQGTIEGAIDAGDGNDTIISGLGDDSVSGGLGNDTLNGGAGNDALNGGSENDTLNGGSDDDVLNGGSGNDMLNGGSGDDVLIGASGVDTLLGGSGSDTFVFSSGFGATNVDIIQGFNHADDVIQLDDDVFTKARPIGALSAGFFRAGTAAQDANDRIIYDASTNSLFYDADGIGGVAQVQFATITGIVGGLTTADFAVIV